LEDDTGGKGKRVGNGGLSWRKRNVTLSSVIVTVLGIVSEV